jgi:hypothetical protein
LGNNALSETTTPSITTSPVMEARSESLPPIVGADRPFMPFFQHKAADLVVERVGSTIQQVPIRNHTTWRSSP